MSNIVRLEQLRELVAKGSKEDQDALHYINFLASTNNADISRWHMLKAFGAEGDDAILIQEKGKINKIFFEKLEKTKARNEKGTVNLEEQEELLKAISAAIEGRSKRKIEELEGAIGTKIRAIRERQERIERFLGEIASLRVEAKGWENNTAGEDIKKELAEVLSEGYWVNPVYERDFLYFNTKNEVVCTYKKAGADLTVNMGKLAVKINLQDLSLLVIPYEGNKSVDGYYHPHVSSSGSICWGDQYERVGKWQGGLEIGKILQLLYSLLFNYDDSAPHMTIQRLASDSVEMNLGLIRRELRHPDLRDKASSEDTFTITFTS